MPASEYGLSSEGEGLLCDSAMPRSDSSVAIGLEGVLLPRASAIILANVASDTLSAHEKTKLFVGLTRALMVVEMVLTTRAERAMLSLFDASQDR
jgi:hypothetical protein